MSILDAEKLLLEFNAWYVSEQSARQRYQAQLAPEFSLLDYLRRDEMALSEYLAMLLDPHGAHGQRDLYLENLLRLPDVQRLTGWLDIKASLRVDTEYRLPSGRRMDIYLHNDSCGLGIENKPWAVDQANQLHDYARYLHGQFPDGQWLLIYLCNGDISECSLPADTPEDLRRGVLVLDFYRLASWLEDSALHTQALPVRLFVEALAQFVREHINGEPSLDNGQDLTQLVLRTPENLKAAFSISQRLREVKRQLWRECLAHIQHELADLDVEMLWDDSLLEGRRYASLSFRFHSTDRYGLAWAFDRANHGALHFGICVWDEADTCREDALSINQAMSRFCQAEGRRSDWWPWWTYDTKAGMGQRLPSDWDLDPEAWLLLQERGETGFAAGVVRMVKRMREEFDLKLLRG
ncbi:PD-(D/E)XK nuclease family protein [Pseudomonas aeruginosa]|uniref:PDDEXK-like family protein n=1 Tax=Pseudomonas aeruginosa TaxID=287 RepID=UPI000507C69D|nr:PD-(D/E)XK nuclease family protein [Pseudomonas aeruginosa]KFJ91709.1 hypothetical protein JF55_11375 [Pseudomonas sp. 1-7]RRJ09546.1 hypothetical protein EIM05_29955 [Pseudomonas aeruginosa]